MSAPDHFPELAEKLQTIRARIQQRIERTPPPVPAMRVPAVEPLADYQELAPTFGESGAASYGPEESLNAPPSLETPPVALSSDAPQQMARFLATAIGTVNPRPPGLLNKLVQTVKRTLVRLFDWQLRPQREFNLAVVESLARQTKALEVADRNFLAMRQALEQRDQAIRQALQQRDQLVRQSLQQLDQVMRQALQQRDQRHQDWGRDFEGLCEQITLQRWAYEGALMRQSNALEQLRQRVATQARAQATRVDGGGQPAAAMASAAASVPIDYIKLEHQFRGTEEDIRRRQRFYLPYFRGRRCVLDIACGRGEFLELMREAGVPAKGVDLDADMVGRCLEKGLEVVQADVFIYLEGVPDGTLDGIFSSQFVEHLEPNVYLRLISQCTAKLAPGGILALETQNPECLAIFSQSFYLDPTHVSPIPPALLRFALVEAGLERVATHSLSPAAAILPLVPQLPAGATEPSALQTYNMAVAKFNETFFGGMDYAVIGYRPSTAA
ncbi:MAG: methyltransferase domain-containing protein [Acidobacteria bacterium]|nr:methyltransferase domain-containing protein [Acidobacteriota bacterium]